jgi:hypothetical protein
MNVSAERTLASLDRLQRVLDERRAQLWISHDTPQSESRRHAPGSYE